jgi:hypothetical protein
MMREGKALFVSGSTERAELEITTTKVWLLNLRKILREPGFTATPPNIKTPITA